MQNDATFSKASVEVSAHGSYVHVTAAGVLASPTEVRAFYQLVEEHLSRAGVRRLLIDARTAEGEPTEEVREASWRGLSRLQLERVAYVVSELQQLKATRLNMTAISTSVPIRAFGSILEAHRWLSSAERRGG
ncbi:MAG: STAS/SEC14 domain-containing protein [Polyangiaceae bacterium]|jgi:hypothetical protein|nr:STAS/SEC14 domain-containing protein [Polyangiaceae bacterium]MBK8940822.1 STAS/SEC14 domain-containing protein [Polyangiaceae bacterium]